MSGGPFAAALDRVTRVPHVQGALVVEVQDGLVVAESVMEGVRGDAAAALASSLAGRLTKVTDATGVGDPRFLYLMAERGDLRLLKEINTLELWKTVCPHSRGLKKCRQMTLSTKVLNQLCSCRVGVESG